jgi:hypothetical protein
LAGHTLGSVLHQAVDRLLELNLHTYFLMATAQLYTQGKLALGLPIPHTPVTRK